MSEGYKEVYFCQYCKSCKYEKLAEHEEPCDDCLNESVNTYSHKPVCYEEADK